MIERVLMDGAAVAPTVASLMAAGIANPIDHDMEYAELHCHSYYSFHDVASSLEELLIRSKELGYGALAITDHDNLCGAMRFSQLSRASEMQGIIGAEVTLRGGHHLTLLAENGMGYSNLCRLITAAHNAGERNVPELPPELLADHATGTSIENTEPLPTCDLRPTEAPSILAMRSTMDRPRPSPGTDPPSSSRRSNSR